MSRINFHGPKYVRAIEVYCIASYDFRAEYKTNNSAVCVLEISAVTFRSSYMPYLTL